jgi:hypothetical protein
MVIIIAKEGQRPIGIERREMAADIVCTHFVPLCGASVAIAFNKPMAGHVEKGVLCRLTDGRLIVDVLRLLQELPLVLLHEIHMPSWA